MSSPETDRPEELATQTQLQDLFIDFSLTLVRLGEFDDDDEPMVGEINGYPVYKFISTLGYRLELQADVLQRVTPYAARFLKISYPVSMTFAPGYYCASGDNENPEVIFDAPEVSISIPEGRTDRRFVVEDLGAESEGDRFRGVRVIDINDGTPFEARLVRAIAYGKSGNADLDRQLGLNQITTNEYHALHDIASNLDRLVE